MRSLWIVLLGLGSVVQFVTDHVSANRGLLNPLQRALPPGGGEAMKPGGSVCCLVLLCQASCIPADKDAIHVGRRM